jgi:hypothetical protein
VLSHAFGHHGEYKVRTTMTTRQLWQYRSSVLRHGKAIKGAFFPILVEHQPALPRGSIRPLNAEEIRTSFAQEAVDVHFTRCAALREYLMLAALYDQPPTRSRGWFTLLAPLAGIAMIVAYGFWAHVVRIDAGQLMGNLASMVTEPPQSAQPKVVPPAASSRTSDRHSVNGQGEPWGPIDAEEIPKAVTVTDLLALEDPPGRAELTASASSSGSSSADLQVGDMLHVTGWLQRISRAPDSTYHLYVSPNRQAGTRVLIGKVPPPNQAQGTPAGQAQLQAVRAFIRQQMLRHQEPSPRGSVMQRPIFVQLTGQLAIPANLPAVPARGKRSQATLAHWEIRPIMEVRFATPSEFSDRSRAQ